MRNWPYAYALGADTKSAVLGKIDVTILPKGGDDGNDAAWLVSCQFMISAYSKVADAAADPVRYLSAVEVQKRIAIHFSVLPTRPGLYSDPEVLANNPFFKIMPNVFNSAVARPSPVGAADYNQLSTAFFQNVNSVLTGGESAQEAVAQVGKVAKRILRQDLVGGDTEGFRGRRLNEGPGAARNYRRGSRTPLDPLAFWRRYSA